MHPKKASAYLSVPMSKYHTAWVFGVWKGQIGFEVLLVRRGLATKQGSFSDEKFLDYLARSRSFGTIRPASCHIGVEMPKKIERPITDRCLEGFPR